MRAHTSPLDHVRVAAPCPADWERMAGGERVRFCQQCSLNVYNISGMSRREAESFVMNAEGRVCVRFYRRADGTILTRNCPVGLTALRRRATRVASAVASAVLGFLSGLGFNTAFSPRRHLLGAMGELAVTAPHRASNEMLGVMPVETPHVQTPPAETPQEKGQVVLVAGRMSYSQLVPETSEARGRRERKRAVRPRGK